MRKEKLLNKIFK